MSVLPSLSPRLISVAYALPPDVLPYVPSKHNAFMAHFGDNFMTPGAESRIWYMDSDWLCLLVLDTGYIEITIKRGWWLDFASIPSILESILKRDDRKGLIAAVCHDVFFAVQYPEFETANSLFYQMMRYELVSRCEAFAKWVGVQSSEGYNAWVKCSDPTAIANESRWVSVKEVPVVSNSHRHLL